MSILNHKFKTPTQIRQSLAKKYETDSTCVDAFAETISTATPNQYFHQAINLLKLDLSEIFKYRNASDQINEATFKKWFPYIENQTTCRTILSWLDPERDFIYNSHGLRLLKNRYLRTSEPIQYCMLRIAYLFIPNNVHEDLLDLCLWKVMYDVFSCGFMHVSSILADADKAHKKIVPGEACRLVVLNPNYDRECVDQINDVCNLISLGVGVGMSASTVPLNGSTTNGKIRDGFKAFARKLDSCNYLSIYERKPKIAIYIDAHNDTFIEACDLRNPIKNHLENVFVGIMMSDYFIECYENDELWYLFPGDARLDGKSLCDYSGDEYKTMYKRFVDAKLYSRTIPSAELMDYLVTSISESGAPYVVWSDNVNRFSNHKHLGKIKTLNLCAEITNYATADRSSSCTLMSVNHAMYKDFPEVFASIYTYVSDLSRFPEFDGVETCESEFKNKKMSTYAYVMGFLGTWSLNVFMGQERQYRELGVSPLGIHDMAMIGNVDPLDIIAEVSEAFYKGSIHASCKHYQCYQQKCQNYIGSPFSQGIPQWSLRGESDAISTNWDSTCELMKQGMSNSLLTAQAPTATTSMLVCVAESVTLPVSIIMSRESENGRNDVICYGLLSKILNNPTKDVELTNDIARQVEMYRLSAPFVDQSQSTMFSIKLTRQNVLDLIINTYVAKLKTAIYYTVPKQINNTLTIVRTESSAKRYYSQMDDSEPKKKLSRRPSCDACSA